MCSNNSTEGIIPLQSQNIVKKKSHIQSHVKRTLSDLSFVTVAIDDFHTGGKSAQCNRWYKLQPNVKVGHHRMFTVTSDATLLLVDTSLV